MDQRISACRNSFEYFVENFVRISDPPFKLLPFQKRLIDLIEEKRFVIGIKFRNGGFSTLSVLYGLWKALLFEDQSILYVCRTDREAVHLGKIVDIAWLNRPEWMRVDCSITQYQKRFLENTMVFSGPNLRGSSLTHLFLDEPAFIPQMTEHWRNLFPTIAAGGKVTALSTTNGVGNWFHDTYCAAEKNLNEFNIFKADYHEHPVYTEEYVEKARKLLGEKAFLQEILCNFVIDNEPEEIDTALKALAKKKKINGREKALLYRAADIVEKYQRNL